jgi:hypothetical protein
MTITASGYEAKYFETYIAVEPSTKVEDTLNLDIVEQSILTEEFNFTFFVHNSTDFGIDWASIQVWWDGMDVSLDVQNLGNGLYFLSLDPITINPGEDPILLNMTISAAGYADKYFETGVTVKPCDIIKDILVLEVIDHSFSKNDFNLKFFLHNSSGSGIHLATFKMWWNGTDVSANVQNLGGGYFSVRLDPLTVAVGDDPVLLNMTISAPGHEDKYLEMHFAVDPQSLLKGNGVPNEPFPFVLVIIVSGICAGVIIGVFTIFLIRKRRTKL